MMLYTRLVPPAPNSTVNVSPLLFLMLRVITSLVLFPRRQGTPPTIPVHLVVSNDTVWGVALPPWLVGPALRNRYCGPVAGMTGAGAGVAGATWTGGLVGCLWPRKEPHPVPMMATIRVATITVMFVFICCSVSVVLCFVVNQTDRMKDYLAVIVYIVLLYGRR